MRLEEQERLRRVQDNANAVAKDARIEELTNQLRDSELKHEQFADDTLRNISGLERCVRKSWREVLPWRIIQHRVVAQRLLGLVFEVFHQIVAFVVFFNLPDSRKQGKRPKGTTILTRITSTLVLPKTQHLHDQLARSFPRRLRFQFRPLLLHLAPQPLVPLLRSYIL